MKYRKKNIHNVSGQYYANEANRKSSFESYDNMSKNTTIAMKYTINFFQTCFQAGISQGLFGIAHPGRFQIRQTLFF